MVSILMRPSMPPNAPPLAPSSASTHAPLQAKPAENDTIVKPAQPLVSLSKARPRRERPCDACRQRKTRCVTNEGETVCAFCKFHKKECTFVQKPAPRKRKLPEDNKPESESSEATRRKPSVDVRNASDIKQEEQFSTSRDLARMSDQDESDSEASQTPFDPSDMSLLGQTTLDFDVLSLLDFDQKQTASSTLGSIRRTEDSYMLVSSDQPIELSASNARDVKDIETIVGDHGPALLDAYFHFVNPNLPVVNEPHLRRLLQQSPSTCSPALLAGIYILGLGFWEHLEGLDGLQKPDAKKLEEVASRSIDSFNAPKNLSTIQAGLLLSHSAAFESWARTCQIIAVAQDVGLHLDCSHWTIPRWERRLRKRVAWALYIQDKWAALIHGRPSHLYSDDWAVPALTPEDFDDGEDLHHKDVDSSATLPTGYMVFEQLVSLTSITSEILETFYTRRAFQESRDAHSGATRLILGQAKPLQMKLKEWFTELPADLKMDNAPETEGNAILSSIEPTGSLHLAYYATEMTLHRRIISSMSLSSTPTALSRPPSQPSSPSKAQSPEPFKQAEHQPADPYLSHIIRTAAKTRLISALDFTNRLRPSHLYSFWHFFSAASFALIGSFGSLLQATAPSQEEVEFYKSRLREYRWTLGVSSKCTQDSGGMMVEAVERLDALTQVLQRAPSKPWLHSGSGGSNAALSAFLDHNLAGEAMDLDSGTAGLSMPSTSGMTGIGHIPRPEFYGQYNSNTQEASSPLEDDESSPTASSAALSLSGYGGIAL